MNDRDLRFIDEYLVDYDAKNAAIRAGFTTATARNAAAWIDTEHPSKPMVRAEIDRRIATLSRRCGITAERVLKELARIAFANYEDAVDPETGKIRKDITRDDSAAIARTRSKVGEDFVENEVIMCDKLKALELLGKRLQLFTDQLEINGSLPVIIDDYVPPVPQEEG